MKRILLALITVCFAASPSWALPANGGFEIGNYPVANPPLTTLNTGSTDLSGWTIGGSVDWVGSYWPAAEGVRSIDLAGNGYGWISQTFDTVPGNLYYVTFFMAGNPEGGDPIKDLFVSAGEKASSYSFDTTGKSLFFMGWEQKLFDFTAVGDKTTLTFLSLEGNSPFGPAVDKIQVTAVPIPTTAWLLGSGLVGLVMIRRRSVN